MKCVIIESPFAGETERNKKYLQRCIRYCFQRGWAPFASHQMYTQALCDSDERDRMMGILAGFVWREKAEKTVFFYDYGVSSGMKKALGHCIEMKHPHEFVTIGKNPDEPEEVKE